MTGWVVRGILALSLLTAGWHVFQQLVARQASRFLAGTGAFEEALRWDPDGGDYHLALGLHYQAQLDPELAEQARPHLERAAELNPYEPRTLQELASLYELTDQRQLAEEAHLKAVGLRPTNGDLLWRVGNFYLRSGELPKALAQLARAMAADPGLVRTAADLLLGVGVPPAEVERLVPPDPNAQRRLLGVLAGRLEREPPAGLLFTTLQVWRRQLASGSLTVPEGTFLINRLARAGLVDVAQREWAALNAANGSPDPLFVEGGNRVWNGDFERPVFGGDLDWVLPSAASYRAVVAAGAGPDGSAALRVEIDGKVPSGLRRAQQQVVLEPGREYTLSAWARAEGFGGAESPRLQVTAAGARRPVATLDAPALDGQWHEGRVRFRAPDKTGLFVVGLVDSLENAREGIVWIDSILLSLAE